MEEPIEKSIPTEDECRLVNTFLEYFLETYEKQNPIDKLEEFTGELILWKYSNSGKELKENDFPNFKELCNPHFRKQLNEILKNPNASKDFRNKRDFLFYLDHFGHMNEFLAILNSEKMLEFIKTSTQWFKEIETSIKNSLLSKDNILLNTWLKFENYTAIQNIFSEKLIGLLSKDEDALYSMYIRLWERAKRNEAAKHTTVIPKFNLNSPTPALSMREEEHRPITSSRSKPNTPTYT